MPAAAYMGETTITSEICRSFASPYKRHIEKTPGQQQQQ